MLPLLSTRGQHDSKTEWLLTLQPPPPPKQASKAANTCDSHTNRRKDKRTIDGEERKYVLIKNKQQTHLSITLDGSLLDPLLPVRLTRDVKF